MGRWRPPAGPSTALITRAGYERLRLELDELWRQRRPEVVAALAAAAAEGDRSENAEYTYRRKQLAEIDRRVRYLGKRLPALRVVETAPGDREAVYFGAWLMLEDLDSGALPSYRILGPDETDAECGWISIDSPLARAALRRRIGEQFAVALPAGSRRFRIIAVSYAGPVGQPSASVDASPADAGA